MYIRTIKYTDFKGNEIEEEFCFHIGKGEVLDLEKESGTSLSKMLINLKTDHSGAKIIDLCKTIIMRSYGVLSDDGKHFWKKPEYLQDFLYSAAYDQLLVDLLEDPSEALNFLASILPLTNEQKEQIRKPIADVKEAVDEAKAKLEAEQQAKLAENVTPILVDNQ